MPINGQPLEPNYGFRDKCYKTKDDAKRSSSSVKLKLTDDQWNDIKSWKSEKKEVVKEKKEVNCPQISKWSDEFSYMATGKRMSKGQLKEYCKRHSKVWENA